MRAREDNREHNLRRHRTLLLESVRTHVLPGFVERGFRSTDLAANAPEHRDSFPLGHLRRPRPDGGVDLVEIQFKSHGRAAFRINACAVPREGMMTVTGWRSPNELEAGGLHDRFELYASPVWRRWFSLRFWWWRTPVAGSYKRLAIKTAAIVSEVDLLLTDGKLGPHVKEIRYPLNHRAPGYKG